MDRFIAAATLEPGRSVRDSTPGIHRGDEVCAAAGLVRNPVRTDVPLAAMTIAVCRRIVDARRAEDRDLLQDPSGEACRRGPYRVIAAPIGPDADPNGMRRQGCRLPVDADRARSR
jgi:hypothetical protein